ncbi:TlyA family RNA methyltransferase [Neptuniibacter pectenicola]|jgi:23S rRNA (cytidine1920-2'-O)/16S rRNA (cytidine1409-2'-O)-methyltransferase|uniref:TlyA family RNA methyltransferase n=1 Tax=Neptuniibacter pectenicola TaxID=1806669 RepID=A0ABU9TRZ8_9GAMM
MQRVDLLLVNNALASTRTHAQRLIKNSKVTAFYKGGWHLITKPGLKLEDDTEFKIEADEADRFVSRGAFKLLAALEKQHVSVKDAIAIDIGQSTGGFSDCLIQAGARCVVGIEVGHSQLAKKLADDSRVICYEGINARELPSEMLLKHTLEGKGFDIAVMDVSFISQLKILPSLAPLIKENGYLISLVKPQFEVGKAGVGRGGIVRDERLYPQVKSNMSDCCADLGLTLCDYFESPIKGGDGNTEFLLIAKKSTP